MAMKAKHAFGNLADVQSAIDSGKLDAYDILFLDGDTAPKIGWIDRNGIFRLVENEADFSELEAVIATKANAEDVEVLEERIATKVDSEEVDVKINEAKAYTDKMVEAAMSEHLTKKFDVLDVPVGTLIDYKENEIRIMCRDDAEWKKQSVGTGGDPNCYYVTFRTYVQNDNVVGYKESLGGQSDKEILTDLSKDEYGRRFQTTWLGVAKYDDATGAWNYYGKNSTSEKFIGWDYQIFWYDVNGVVIASDCVRINLSNENCHYSTKPYYIGSMMKDVETMMEEKVAEVNSAYEIVEF